MRYTLMHKLIPVMEITFDVTNGIMLSLDKLYDPNHLPVGIPVYNGSVNFDKLKHWWKRRSIPASRSGLRQFLEKINITVVHTLIKECYGLSLSDQYWIRPENS